MTALQQLEQRSEQKGRQEGMEKRNIEIARNMLSEGLAFNLVLKLSGLSEEALMKLKEEFKR
ncbi:MAG: hypothetical protein ACX93T_01900 [Bacteroidota bacterium]